MTRRGTVENLIRRYGETVSYGGEKFRAILRPYQTGGTSLPDTRYFLYTGPAAHRLAEGGTVSAQGNDFSVRRSDTYFFCGEALYVRAVLARILPESGIRLERGGMVFARAESCTEEAVQSAEAEIPWGAFSPAAVSEGAVSWKLTLRGVRPEDGADLFAPGIFRTVVETEGGTAVYSGCRWKTVRKSGGPILESSREIEILAAKRSAETKEDG
jgi:hypothetical protein